MLTSKPQYGDLNHLKSISWWFYSRKYLWHILALSYLSDITAMVDTIKTSPLTFRVYSYNPRQSPVVTPIAFPLYWWFPVTSRIFSAWSEGFLDYFDTKVPLLSPGTGTGSSTAFLSTEVALATLRALSTWANSVSKWNANDGGQFRNRLKS